MTKTNLKKMFAAHRAALKRVYAAARTAGWPIAQGVKFDDSNDFDFFLINANDDMYGESAERRAANAAADLICKGSRAKRYGPNRDEWLCGTVDGTKIIMWCDGDTASLHTEVQSMFD